MTEISTYYLRNVLCRECCSIIGRISDAYFDEKCKNIVYFAIDNAADGPNTKLLLPFSAIEACADAIVIQSKAALVPQDDIDITALIPNLIGKSIYTANGIFKGIVSHVKTRGASVSRICTEKGEFTPSSFSAFGEIALLKPEGRLTKKQSIPRPDVESKVFILEEAHSNQLKNADIVISSQNTSYSEVSDALPQTAQPPVAQSDILQTPQPFPTITLGTDSREPVFTKDALELLLGAAAKPFEDSDGHNPPRIICEYDFLLGRTLASDLKSYIGETLAYKGDVITHELVERTRRCGKLVELTLNSK